MVNTVSLWNPEPPDGGEEVEILTPWCCLCGKGEDHRNIKICQNCIDYYNKYNEL